MMKKKKYAFGTQTSNQVPVEVENDEVAETPQGNIINYSGVPSHENGGYDDTLPQGTDIYSSRLSVDGKSMAERKLVRESALKRLQKSAKRHPVDAITNNSIKRVTNQNEQEEQQDMMMQELASKIYQQPQEKKAFGGTLDSNLFQTDKTAFIDSTLNANKNLEWINRLYDKVPQTIQVPGEDFTSTHLMSSGETDGKHFAFPRIQSVKDKLTDLGKKKAFDYSIDNNTAISFDSEEKANFFAENYKNGTGVTIGKKAFGGKLKKYAYGGETDQNELYNRQPSDIAPLELLGLKDLSASTPITNENEVGVPSFTPKYDKTPIAGTPNTAGNIMGMVGTAVNTFAPLFTTNQYWKNRVKPTNPYLGFNKDALETNDAAINQLTGQKDLAQSNILRNRTNTINRNNQSTRSINTQRALNAGTDIAFGDETNTSNATFASQNANLLNQRSQLQTQRDSAIMGGAAQVQNQNRTDVENYFTALNKDRGNVGTGLQRGGQILNQQKQQQDFLAILPMLSKYGLGITYIDGKPTLTNT